MGNARLVHEAGELELAELAATDGEAGWDTGMLLKKTGHVAYDPGFVNTASCRSAITYIDGDAGILRYRGYPIEQLAAHSTFTEVSYLLHLRRAAHGRRAQAASRPTSGRTRCSTRTCAGSSTASPATRTRCRC